MATVGKHLIRQILASMHRLIMNEIGINCALYGQ